MCAPLGIDVMMEKPFAIGMDDARAMAAAAAKGGIQLVVNYETTWYRSTQAAYGFVDGQRGIGEIRKIVVHDGHQGPASIGCSAAFLEWLTDPVKNGGGALMDFGCYGADLVAWLMQGQRPTSVFAVTQHLQPAVYPKVDDEATIVVTYPRAQAILQASWNWPYGRKDMEIYGQTGAVLLPGPQLAGAAEGRCARRRACRPRAGRPRLRRAVLPCRSRPPRDQALRALVGRGQPPRHRDTRRRPRVGPHGPAGRPAPAVRPRTAHPSRMPVVGGFRPPVDLEWEPPRGGVNQERR